MKAAAHYNAGNTLTASGNLEGAIEEYKKAVRLDQTSGDIRHNLEIAVREWKKQQENKKSENKEENQDGEKKEENKEDKEDSGKKEDNQEDREKEDEGEESETPDQDEQQQQDQEQQQSKQQVNQSQKMTPEEAMRILDALNDEEKKALSLRRSQMKTDVQQGDDW
ncbi:MAG: tetratricopeptide repeat protein [Candidatus Latescibacteria bacterium]|nr:tetratricopeptide repeat protein [Candidatus Latescibacterota bacterium]